ncbi:hypothetical protein D7D53_00845 [Streptococcus gwangjuense]|uniref:Uncharacterized protein n=1 Tax=Streptococcus gwangjuensis TaxID=1433513 RepID=A0A387AYI5_9STRE|nr:hypothetical protein D7D53_00845 [Streptococcus gwangjuense]
MFHLDSFLFYKQFKLFYFQSISFLKSESKKKSTESVSADKKGSLCPRKHLIFFIEKRLSFCYNRIKYLL